MAVNKTQVTPDMNRTSLEDDLKEYAELAIEIGADLVEVIPIEQVRVDDRVAFKCRSPRCFGYGACANCPPHAPTPAEIRDLLKSYEKALIFARHVPTEILMRDRADEERRAAFRSIYEILGKLEAKAFYGGHYLSTGFAAGSCRSAFCKPDVPCAALEGQACKFAIRARPSMEAVGIDVYGMITDAGWESGGPQKSDSCVRLNRP